MIDAMSSVGLGSTRRFLGQLRHAHSLKTCTGQLPRPLMPHQSRMHLRWNLQRHSKRPISSPGWNSSMQIVHSCSRPSPSTQSFSVATYGKMPRERYDIARLRALVTGSPLVGEPKEEGKFGSCGFVGGIGPRLGTGGVWTDGVEKRLLTHVWI